ncbi:MAG: hypothetical protein ABII22_01375 [Candidatus Micrarchaeota archaeon]
MASQQQKALPAKQGLGPTSPKTTSTSLTPGSNAKLPPDTLPARKMGEIWWDNRTTTTSIQIHEKRVLELESYDSSVEPCKGRVIVHSKDEEPRDAEIQELITGLRFLNNDRIRYHQSSYVSGLAKRTIRFLEARIAKFLLKNGYPKTTEKECLGEQCPKVGDLNQEIAFLNGKNRRLMQQIERGVKEASKGSVRLEGLDLEGVLSPFEAIITIGDPKDMNKVLIIPSQRIATINGKPIDKETAEAVCDVLRYHLTSTPPPLERRFIDKVLAMLQSSNSNMAEQAQAEPTEKKPEAERITHDAFLILQDQLADPYKRASAEKELMNAKLNIPQIVLLLETINSIPGLRVKLWELGKKCLDILRDGKDTADVIWAIKEVKRLRSSKGKSVADWIEKYIETANYW